MGKPLCFSRVSRNLLLADSLLLGICFAKGDFYLVPLLAFVSLRQTDVFGGLLRTLVFRGPLPTLLFL